MTGAEQVPGTLFVITAPSGTGKSTIASRLLERTRRLCFSVSYTTRKPRRGEQDGREYHFVDDDRFEEMVGRNAFLEWADVFGNRYGTGLDSTRQALADGTDLLLDIDIQGAGQVRRGPLPAVTIMILPPDYQTLTARLQARGSEEQCQRELRLAKARREVEQYPDFDFLAINDHLDRTVSELESIVRAERARTGRRLAAARAVLATFPSRV
jgi:guanylate kinase